MIIRVKYPAPKQNAIMIERIIDNIQVAIYKIEIIQVKNAKLKVATIEKVINKWQITHGINIKI